ncbi:cytochrome P450 [Amylocarpus encephaloides]|uniref:Cytochrome P450 n=1 Tax=Amylocarpus encephaloides TaxID=45428 RepID=A0A9P7YIK2_9HELO|nr:cytochrome P450 [Amylocarpus encephaloides]
MSVIELVFNSTIAHPLISGLLFTLLFLLSYAVQRIYVHPIAHIPGPFIAKLSSVWLWYHSYIGDEATIVHELHAQYGPLVRVSPNTVDISDPAAIAPIYVQRGGFPKADCYVNFDIEGHKTIFSTTDNEYRSPRAKAVVALFSTKSIKENEGPLYGCMDRMVARMKEEKTREGRVDVLNLTRSLAVDAVSTQLFRQNYNGVAEKGDTLSISAFVDTFVAVGRFFYLPNRLFSWLEWGTERFLGDINTATSFDVVERFAEELLEKTEAGDNNFPGRLLSIGLSKSEVKAQCKDLIFAGTDSTGMNIATICRQLANHPDKYQHLRSELHANAKLDSSSRQEIQSLSYLSAVIKEGLRISMANPTRLPRIVSVNDFYLNGTHIPNNTIVGCAAYSLHLSPAIFPSPWEFRPERWLEPNVTPQMNVSFFAWGSGNRACIARNLATTELFMATERVVSSGVLDGARIGPEVEIWEWFNSSVKGGKIELFWDMKR